MTKASLHEEFSVESSRHGCLPNGAYTEQTWFESERQSVMSSTWQYAGRASAIPNPGDMLPATVAATPIFLIRQKSGEINGFYLSLIHI